MNAGQISPGVPEPESRFTAPTERCPHPEWWTSTDPDSTEREVAALIYGLVRGLQPRLCLETGTAFGEVAHAIGSALKANGHGRLVTIESDPYRVAFAGRRLRGLPVYVIEGNTLDVEIDLPAGQPVDFAFFDSYYRLRVDEFRRFQPFMRPGTIVAFHDTAPGHAAEAGIPDSDIFSTIARGLRGDVKLVNLPTPRGLAIGEVLR